MAKVFSFKALETDAEVEFINREVRRTNTNISTVIKQLIRNAMDEKKREDQTEMFKAELGKLIKIGLSAAENAIYTKHIAQANYIELVKEDQSKIDETKKYAIELTKEEMDEIQ